MATQCLEKTNLKGVIPFTAARKALKWALLAAMNGSSIDNQEPIIKLLSGHNDSEDKNCARWVHLVKEHVSSLEAMKKIKETTWPWYKDGKVYPLGS